ncbi:MAG: hypothetical protein H0W22_04185, partial [Chloroflexi bacterium]|nr:hypothetical protein [Chloroflexota bacterium]
PPSGRTLSGGLDPIALYPPKRFFGAARNIEEGTLKMVWTMRRMLSAVGTNEGIEILLNRLSKTQSNADFLASLTKNLDA